MHHSQVGRTPLTLRRACRIAAVLASALAAIAILLPWSPGFAAASDEVFTVFDQSSVPLPPIPEELAAGSAGTVINDGTVSLPVSVTVIPAPNLVPAILCATWDNIDTVAYTVTCAIVNDSDGEAAASTAQLSLDGVMVWSESVPALGPGQSHSFEREYTLSGAVDDITLVADVYEEVDWELSEDNTATISVSSPQEMTLSLSLVAGWNMVSVPLLLENTSPEMVFPGVAAIYEWDPVNMTYSSPTSIDPTRSYWVAVAEPTTLPDIQGLALTSYVVELDAGWHMLGSVWLDGGGLSHLAGAPPLSTPTYCVTAGEESYQVTTGVETGAGFWLAVHETCLVQVS